MNNQVYIVTLQNSYFDPSITIHSVWTYEEDAWECIDISRKYNKVGIYKLTSFPVYDHFSLDTLANVYEHFERSKKDE